MNIFENRVLNILHESNTCQTGVIFFTHDISKDPLSADAVLDLYKTALADLIVPGTVLAYFMIQIEVIGYKSMIFSI